MLDGYESGMSSARESCKSTELKRCIATEMRWSKYELSPVFFAGYSNNIVFIKYIRCYFNRFVNVKLELPFP